MSTIKSDTENLIFDAVGASSEIRLYLDGTQTVTLDSSGNFGIGTSSPSAVLDVNGTAKVTALNINGTALSASATELSLLNGITGIADEDDMSSDSATQLATQQSIKAYVDTSITNLIGGAPGALDTLNELAAAINDDADVYSTLTTSIASKIGDVVDDTTPQLGGTLDANGNSIDMGTNTITDTKVGQWDTAYGWGNHASAGYLTSFTESNDLSASVTWANVPNANITESSVTQHESALTITESQISDLQSYLTSETYSTANELLTAIKTVDGASSGLDADTLDGNEATAFATAAQGSTADSALQDITGESIESLSDVNSMTPSDGQLLTWDNANSRWDAADAPVSLPSQTGNNGYYLTTDGSSASWAALSTTFPFYDSSGSADNISVTNGQFPFYNSSGTQDNIGVS